MLDNMSTFKNSLSPLGYALMLLVVSSIVISCPELEGLKGALGSAQTPDSFTPSDGAEISSVKPKLSWNPIEGATGYNIQLSDNKETLYKAPVKQSTLNFYIPETDLRNFQTYYWRVQPLFSGAEKGAWSNIVSLYRFSATISGLSPSDGSSTGTNPPLLSWDSIDNVKNYKLQIAESEEGFSSASIEVIVCNSYTPTIAFKNLQTYYWRVKSVGIDGTEGEWSDATSLYMNLGDIRSFNPASGTRTENRIPKFSWDSIASASSYKFQVAESKSALDGAKAWDLNTNSYTPPSTLKNLQTYYWRVKSIAVGGSEGAWSTPASLSVATGTISNLSPTVGYKTSDTTPTFTWDLFSEAKSYGVQMSESEEGLDTAKVQIVDGNSYTPDSAITERQMHYWRVRPHGTDGTEGLWSNVVSLYVNLHIDTLKYNLIDFDEITKTTQVKDIAFSPDGKYLAAAVGARNPETTLIIWDIATRKVKLRLDDNDKSVKTVCYSPDGRYIAGGSYTSPGLKTLVRIWDASTGTLEKTIETNGSSVDSLSYSPDGKYLAYSDYTLDVEVYNVATGKVEHTLKRHEKYVLQVMFSPDGQYLASAGYDDYIVIWEVSTGKIAKLLDRRIPHSLIDLADFLTMDYSPNGEYLAIGTSASSIHIWDIAAGSVKQILKGHSDWVQSVSYSPDGKSLASGGADHKIKIWDADTGSLKRTFDENNSGHINSVVSVKYSPDGRYLASGSFDYTIKIWE